MSSYQADIDQRANDHAYVVPLPNVLSALALVVSLATALWTVTHDPLGKGLSQYDFSTPKAALVSTMEMQNKPDFKALMELAAGASEDLGFGVTAEKQRTLKVHKEAGWRGKQILFCSFEKDGVPEYTCEAVEKDARTGRWMPSTMPWVFDVEKGGSEEDKRLSKMVSRWREAGAF